MQDNGRFEGQRKRGEGRPFLYFNLWFIFLCFFTPLDHNEKVFLSFCTWSFGHNEELGFQLCGESKR